MAETIVSSDVEVYGIGDGGNIDIEAQNLSVTGGAAISTQTLGQGNAGNIQVKTSDYVNISGLTPLVVENGNVTGISSGLFSSTLEEAIGRGGAVNITTSNLQISDRAAVSARSKNDFNGGSITVNANNLEITGGSQIVTTAFGKGNAGDINLNVSDRINISGQDPTFLERFNQLADVPFVFDFFETQSPGINLCKSGQLASELLVPPDEGLQCS